jgi:hypothetical protein
VLTLRRDQSGAFAETMEAGFACQMLDHLEQFAPDHLRRVGAHVAKEVVRHGIINAKQYGLTLRGSVRLYLELMWMLGSQFDTDPQYSWAAEILGDRSCEQMQRADRLHQRAAIYHHQVVGVDGEHEREAIRRLVKLNVLAELPSNAPFEGLLETASVVYPRKADFVGAAALSEVVTRAAKIADERFEAGSSCVSLFAVLMFAFGHGCLTDPQFAWIAHIVNGASEITHAEVERQLRASFVSYLTSRGAW